ncbi:MAG: TrmH family RNA methyltransferase [Candidatus Sericytochromatia bacterium]
MKLNSKENRLIKLAKKLHNKKDRKENQLFIIEGEKLIKDAIKSNVSISTIFIKDNLDLSFESKAEIFEISDDLMSYISTTESSPPCLALAKIEDKKLDKDKSFVLVLNDLQDPGNLGTILRSSEASGVDLVVASKTTTVVYNALVLRSSMFA